MDTWVKTKVEVDVENMKGQECIVQKAVGRGFPPRVLPLRRVKSHHTIHFRDERCDDLLAH